MKIKIGVLQAEAAPGNITKNLQTIQDALTTAAEQNIDLLVTPELFATSYNPVAAAKINGSDIRKQLSQAARDNKVALVASTPDKHANKNYISASFFDSQGLELCKAYKTFLYGPQEVANFEPGKFSKIFNWHGINFGLGICYDIEFPEFARTQTKAGAEILLIPTAVPNLERNANTESRTDATDPWHYSATQTSLLQVPARALENGVVIAYANHTGKGFTGNSCIATPTGKFAAKAQQESTIISAVIDTEYIKNARKINTYLEDLAAYQAVNNA